MGIQRLPLMRLLLAYPEIETSNTNTSTYSLPLGLGSIATFCKKEMEDSLEVKILDGSIMSHEEELEQICEFKPDVTGINPTMASQKNGLEVGRVAKDNDSLVFYGGVNSTNLWKNMLNNREFIDGIVLYDGEFPMQLILEGQPFKQIPNLAYRDSEGNVQPPKQIYIPSMHELPNIDYSLFDMERFLEHTQKRGFGKAVTYYAGKGCSKRGGIKAEQFYSYDTYLRLVSLMNTCSFCGRNELGFRNFEEHRETNIVKQLNEEFGINGFFNVQDTVNLNYVTPIGLDDSWFRLFIGIGKVTSRDIATLKQRYGDNLIFQVGVESASPSMRKVYGKPVTDSKDIFEKVKLMEDEGVQLHASFILGGKQETVESMKETTNVARRLAEHSNVTWILISPQLILPGSPDYRSFLDIPEMHKKYADKDLVDIVEINKDFLECFSPGLEREMIIDELRDTFEDIKATNPKIVRDVKGVVQEEEEIIRY